VSLLLPVEATAAVAEGDDRGVLVAARRGAVLHVTRPGRVLTQAGRVRRDARPLCGRRSRSWRYVWQVDGRPLCRTCAAVVQTRCSLQQLLSVRERVTAYEIADTVLSARDEATVTAAVALLLAGGHTAKAVTLPDGTTARLSRLVAQTRQRLSRPASPLTDADRAWFSAVKNAPASRFPRRSA
jgi:hypothetical protein